MIAAASVAAPIVLGALLFLVWVRFVYPDRAVGAAAGEPIRYLVPSDADAAHVAADLGQAGLVETPFLFATYLRLVGASGHYRTGETVTLPRGLTAEQLARRLARGLGAVVARVTIPEGFDQVDVARRLADAQLGSEEDFRRAMRDPALLESLEIQGESIEGHLFPDTYELTDDEGPLGILRSMARNYERRTGELFDRHEDALQRLHDELGFTRADVLVLASIVEKEAAVADERPIIAGVFLNRLRSESFLPRQRLQSDPTVSYGCRVEPERAPSCAGFSGRITRAMLEDSQNRYNTYRHGGLPPGPISNPGLSAIEAVLAPARHDYFYFVARGGRRHAFSHDLEAHQDAVDSARDRGVLP